MADWFSKLSPPAQKAYIKKHPTSKYAKAYRKKNRSKVSGVDAIKQASKKLAALSTPPKSKPKIDPVKVSKLRSQVSDFKSKMSSLRDTVDGLHKVYKSMQSK